MLHLQGTYHFHASSAQVFAALLDPTMLKATIPGCEHAWYAAEHGHIKVRLVSSIVGLEGPYDITVEVVERAEPHTLVLRTGRSGPIGGTVDILTTLTLVREREGTQLNYDANADLSGPVAAANNPLFVSMAKHGLKTFFKRLDARLNCMYLA